ncbi:MAG: glycosyltransferase [Lachnospiraceae bacterium]|nr:glycosyltransferase [Lachnospiraceae bacterium]
MKKILFVMNTMGRAGAETALLELLRRIDRSEYDISLFVLTGQGELINSLPLGVKLLNRYSDTTSVHSREGRKHLFVSGLKVLLKRFNFVRLLPYFAVNAAEMIKKRNLQIEKLLWRAFSDGAERSETKYDLAVSYIEGAAAYYVADHVMADKKAAFIHVDYKKSGYTRNLDKDCYLKFDRIFGVSKEVTDVFLNVYPELAGKTEVFHNLIDAEGIRRKADSGIGFTDDFSGIRLLTVGRLMAQKSFETSIKACYILKKHGENIRWYVLGEGDRREKLQALIEKLGLERDFILCGAVDNPYPYMKEADIYAHCSRFEGKSIAVQEAQVLGKPIIVSDCSGNREQVIPDEDGVICEFDPRSIAKSIYELIHDENKRDKISKNALVKNNGEEEALSRLLEI